MGRSRVAGLSGRDLKKVAEELGNLVHPQIPVQEDFLEAIAKVRGKGSTDTDEDASWETLVVKPEVKETLQTYCAILSDFESFKKQGITVPDGLLLYGPPGTGKTQIARTLANESDLGFIGCTTTDLKAGYIGQSAMKVREVFDRARSQAPCILFIDELDTVAPRRGSNLDYFSEEIIGQLLQELSGIKPQLTPIFL